MLYKKTYSIDFELNNGLISFDKDYIKFNEEVEISNPIKNVMIEIKDNGTKAEIGKRPDEITSIFLGWTSKNINNTTALIDGNKWEDSSKPLLGNKFKSLTNADTDRVTLIANCKEENVVLPLVTKDGYTCSYNTDKLGNGTSYSGVIYLL